MRRIYIETTIPSFFYEVRNDPASVARRDWTKLWLDEALQTEQVVSSAAVLQELLRGEFPGKLAAISLVKSLEALPITSEVLLIVEEYIRRKLMPQDPAGDALHLAVASYHCCDYLVTWNCRHLANANKFGQIHQINDMLGLTTPILTTPLQLLGGDSHES